MAETIQDVGSKVFGKVGSFLGISKSGLSNIERWRERAEKRIQNKEFGLSIKHSLHSNKARNDSKFVSDARKVMSQIEAVQRLEDIESNSEQLNKGQSQSKMQLEFNAASVLDYSKAGPSTSQDNPKFHNDRPNPSAVVQQKGTQKPSTNKTQELKENVSPLKTDETDRKSKNDLSPHVVRSKPVMLVFNESYSEKDDDSDNSIAEYKGSSSVISKKLMKSCTSLPECSTASGGTSLQTKHGGSEPTFIFFNKTLNIRPSVELADQRSQSESSVKYYKRLEHKCKSFGDKLNKIMFTSKKGDRKIKESFDAIKAISTDTIGSQQSADCSEVDRDEESEKNEKQKVNADEIEVTLSDSVQENTNNELVRGTSAICSDCSEVDRDEESEKNEKQKVNADEIEVTLSESVQENTTNELIEDTLKADDLVYGKEALLHYSFYVQVEKKVEKQRLVKNLAEKMSEYDWKIKSIDDLIEMAKDYYLKPESKKAAKWKDLRRKVNRSSSRKLGRTEVRRKLDTLPEYRPYFTWFIILAQIIAVVVTCSLGGLTSIGLEPQLSLEKDIKTFIGIETIHKWSAPNIWLGPSQKYLISVGALFAPCMRKDLEIQLMYSTHNFTDHSPLGCCEIKSRNIAGTTTKAECELLSEGIAVWRGDFTCAQRPVGEKSVLHLLRPCCLGVKGQCRLLSHKHCIFLAGSFHQFDAEHCSQVTCLSDVCGLGQLVPSPEQPWFPDAPYQWWRLPLSLLYHHGIIHVAIVSLAQWLLFTQVECTAGWLRMMIIYFLSGMGALLISAVFTPYQSHVGGVGAVFGMVGVVLVELIQFWSMVQGPRQELAKILIAIAIFLFFGTLPYMDFFGMFGGFTIGILTGIIVLPYITLGKWGNTARIILIGVGIPLLVVIFSVLLHLFIKVQSVSNCSLCRSINCISYTKNMCETSLWQQF